jgi:predicted chitinase
VSYLKTLNNTQKNNANLIIAAAKENGITNPLSIAAILAIVSKESNFIPKSENLNYTAKRITEVWPKIPLALAKTLQNNPQKLANYVYGQKPYGMRDNAFGNTNPNDGFLFSGKGFNQLTFKGNYKKIGDLIGIDLISNPNIANTPEIASKVLIAFYKLAEKRNKLDLNNLGSQKQVLDTIYQINAGKVNKPISDTTGGYKKALDRFNDLMTFTGTEKKKIAGIGSIILFSLLIGYYLFKK